MGLELLPLLGTLSGIDSVGSWLTHSGAYPCDGGVCAPQCAWGNSLKVGLADYFLLLFKFMVLVHDLGTRKAKGEGCISLSRLGSLFLCSLSSVPGQGEGEAGGSVRLPLVRTNWSRF